MARNRRRPPAPPQTPSQQAHAARIAIQTRQEWSGPLPPPQALEAFEQIAPGTAAKIIEEFQAEAAHRRALEVKQTDLIVRETHLGQASAIVFALSALGVAGYAAYIGAEWIGAIVGGGVIVSGIIALRSRPKA